LRAAAGAALLVAAACLQVSLAPRLEVAGAFPNLVLLGVVGWTLVAGAGAGLRWAVAGGLLLDLLTPGPFGVHALALAVAAYLAGYGQRAFQGDPFLLPFASGALATVAYNLVLLGAADVLGQRVLLSVLQSWVAPAALYDAVLMPAAVLALRRLDAKFPAALGPTW
jgi:rod shape-determining protein MreD